MVISFCGMPVLCRAHRFHTVEIVKDKMKWDPKHIPLPNMSWPRFQWFDNSQTGIRETRRFGCFLSVHGSRPIGTIGRKSTNRLVAIQMQGPPYLTNEVTFVQSKALSMFTSQGSFGALFPPNLRLTDTFAAGQQIQQHLAALLKDFCKSREVAKEKKKSRQRLNQLFLDFLRGF